VGHHRGSWHWHRHRSGIWWVVITGRSLIVSFRNGGQPLGFRCPPSQAVIVSQVRVSIEEKQVGVEELAVSAEHPHEQLH
jgi:hypothetical protein